MNDPTLFGRNLEKIRELHPDAQPPAYAWNRQCFSENKMFEIIEAKRTQDRQNRLIRQGRFTEADFLVDVRAGKMTKSTAERGIALVRKYGGIKGPKVTWTLDSKHIVGLALDIRPIGCTHAEIAGIAAKYGITHPFPRDDPPHYEFDKAYVPFIIVNPVQRRMRLEAKIASTTDERLRKVYQAELDRLRSRP